MQVMVTTIPMVGCFITLGDLLKGQKPSAKKQKRKRRTAK
jgi:hypothetical protein